MMATRKVFPQPFPRRVRFSLYIQIWPVKQSIYEKKKHKCIWILSPGTKVYRSMPGWTVLYSSLKCVLIVEHISGARCTHYFLHIHCPRSILNGRHKPVLHTSNKTWHTINVSLYCAFSMRLYTNCVDVQNDHECDHRPTWPIFKSSNHEYCLAIEVSVWIVVYNCGFLELQTYVHVF